MDILLKWVHKLYPRLGIFPILLCFACKLSFLLSPGAFYHQLCTLLNSSERFYLSILTDPHALTDLVGMSRVPAWKLQQRRKRLSVCSSCWQHHDWHQWQYSHRVYGLHQREMLSGKVQILSSSRTSASQDQGCPIPGQPGCSSAGCSHCSRHGE